MKTLIIFMLIIFFNCPVGVKAQPGLITDTIVISAAPREKHVFKSIAIVHDKQRTHLEFAVRKVRNVRNYRIEAGDDSLNLTIIGNVIPACNTVMPAAFAYPLNGYLAQYRYYRVIQVGMGQDWLASPLLNQFPDHKYTGKYVDENGKDPVEAVASCVKQ